MRFHTLECSKIVGLPRRMKDLDDIEQTYVLNCPHQSHDATRIMYGYLPMTQDTKLVKK